MCLLVPGGSQKERTFILSPFTKKGVCVCYPLYQRVVTSFNQCLQQCEINHAGGPRAIGWLGPTKTHPMCRVNVPARKKGRHGYLRVQLVAMI